MTQDCNADLLATARANVAQRQNPAHWRAIASGDWDPVYNDAGECVAGTLVHAEIARLLREPVLVEGEDA